MRVAVCQPHYLPWIGYFAMIQSCDAFVFLDDVQFEKQSWQQRNRIKRPDGQPMWLTVPIMREFGQKINEVKIKPGSNWHRKHWESIRQAYSSAKYFDAVFYEKSLELNLPWTFLHSLNIRLTKQMSSWIGTKEPEWLMSSDMNLKTTRTDHLLGILKTVGATEYLANPGSMGYLEPERPNFTEAGITLKVFNFRHPVYPQVHGEFMPYMSAIDLLVNVGPKAMDYIREGSKDAIVG